MTSRGFYIGRFQPYHNGHQSVLEEIGQKIKDLGLDPKAPKWSLYRQLEHYKNGSSEEILMRIQAAMSNLKELEAALKGAK